MQKARYHFSKIANIQCRVNMCVVSEYPEFSRGKLVGWDPPSKSEVVDVVKGLKNNKSQDVLGVHPELLKAACENTEVSDLFHELIVRMWKGMEDPPEY